MHPDDARSGREMIAISSDSVPFDFMSPLCYLGGGASMLEAVVDGARRRRGAHMQQMVE